MSLQFNLRALFVVTFVAAIYVFIAQTAGYGVSAGIVVSALIIASAFCLGWRWLPFWGEIGAKTVVVFLSLTAIWFLAVDSSWFVNSCPDCIYRQHSFPWRIIGIPVHVIEDEDPSFLNDAMQAIGQPCRHRRSIYWHKHRWWGLLICGRPCINGIMGLIYERDQETLDTLEKLRQIGEENPELAAELHQKVIVEHDYAYYRTFADEHIYALGSASAD